MKITGISTAVLMIFLAFAPPLSPLAYGQTSVPGAGKSVKDSNDGEWNFTVAPYMWAVSMDGKVTVGDYSTSSSMSFSDIMKNLQVGGLMHMEARKGSLGFFVDPIYLKMREDKTLSAVSSGAPQPATRDITATIETWLVEFGAIYQAGKWKLGEKDAARSASLDIYGGGRYWYMHSNLDTSGPANPTSTVDFVDPMIGLSFNTDLTERVVLNLRGDIGGFGVGSDFSWSAAALFGYRFTRDITGFLGYRALYLDYKTSHSPRFKITMQGPITGIQFAF
ncbi:MAG: hypothetical protein ABFD97_15420 [Syntrophobacter sp.]